MTPLLQCSTVPFGSVMRHVDSRMLRSGSCLIEATTGETQLMEGPMSPTKLIGILLVATSLSFSALAERLPAAGQPEALGFSAERLKRLGNAFQADIDKGAIPGAVVLIARNGKVAYFEAFGFQDREKRIAMKNDGIFRIASMTK